MLRRQSPFSSYFLDIRRLMLYLSYCTFDSGLLLLLHPSLQTLILSLL